MRRLAGCKFTVNRLNRAFFLNMNYRAGYEVCIFGFSRGAATARGVTQFLTNDERSALLEFLKSL